MFKKRKAFALILIAILSLTTFLVYGDDVTLGTVSNDLLGPVNAARYVFNAAAFIVGAFLVIGSFNKYLKHRQNPQEAPIGGVIIWFVLGLAMLAIPVLHYLSVKAAIGTGAGDVVGN